MSNGFSKYTRAIAIALSGALAASLATPVAAAPIPVVKSIDAVTVAEQVQYRTKRAPARVKRRGNNGAAAAAIIGAVAVGAAAIAASNAERRRQRRIEREYYYGAGHPYGGYGYAQPQPHYAQPQPRYRYVQPQPQPQPQYYGNGYYQHQQPVRQPRAYRGDPSSPYAVQPYARQPNYYGETRAQRVPGGVIFVGPQSDPRMNAPESTPF